MIRRFDRTIWCSLAVVSIAASCGGEDPPDVPPVPALEIVTTTLPAGRLGEAYDQKINVRGGETPYTFAISAGELPNGFELKSATGQITGIAGAAGPSSFTVQVTDAGGRTKTQALSIYVEPDPLEIVSTTLLDGLQGDPYEATLTGRGGVTPLSWMLVSGALPAGLMLSSAGVLSGTPSEFGMFTFDLRLSDAETRTATRTFMLGIVSRMPMIQTATLARAQENAPFEATFEASGGTPPYTWSLGSGALPRGLGIDAEGHLAGTPTEDGLFRFSVVVDDARGERDERPYSLSVLGPLVITTSALPLVLMNRPVDFQVVATGGLPPYNWFLSGTLPTGLTFTSDGRLTGTTAVPGEFPITVRVQDSLGGSPRSKMFTLRVSDQISYEVTPALSIPAVCTATRVSYSIVEIPITDSLVIDDLSVTVEVPYDDGNPNEQQGALRLVLWAPDGRRAVLCGNSAGVRAEPGCTLLQQGGQTGVFITYDNSTTGPSEPDQPLRVFHGMNAQGTWRFEATVARPGVDAQGNCRQEGRVDLVRLTMRDDRSSDPYILVTGIERNNLVIDPWVRLSGNGVPENEIFLRATLWDVGPNGVREAGRGDDVPDSRPFTWSAGGPLPLGTTISPDGHVVGGTCTRGQPCRGGEGPITASDGQGNATTLRLLVIPPDFNHSVREF